MKDDPDRIYVDTIQTLPGKRYIFGSLRLIHKMGEYARMRGINKFSAHLRTINGFSKTILKTFPTVRRIRQVDNWYGWGEPFDYVEGIITGDEWGNRQH